jgi:hypothetical protein
VVLDRKEILMFCTAARPGMGPTQLFIKLVLVVISSRINGPEDEVEYRG